jgi:hypothetical protein
MLAELRLMAIIGMLLLLTATLAISRLMGARTPERRKSMALTTSLRNPGSDW